MPPNLAQGPPKTAQIDQNGNLKVPVVPNGSNSVERSWNGLWEVQVKVFEPIWRSWAPQNLAQGHPKTARSGDLKVLVVPNGWNKVGTGFGRSKSWPMGAQKWRKLTNKS